MTDGIIVCTNRTSWTKAKPVRDGLKLPGAEVYVAGGGDFVTTHPDDCDWRIYGLVKGNEPISMVKTVAAHTAEMGSLFEATKPRFVVTIADRYETLGTAIAASYQNIPLIHLQGGEVTGTIDDKVRNAVTQLADYHMVSNFEARLQLTAQLGVPASRITVTGCPSISSIPQERPRPNLHEFGKGAAIDRGCPYIIVMFHPDTTSYTAAAHQIDSLWDGVREYLLQCWDLKVLWMSPNVDAGGDAMRKWLRVTPNSDSTFSTRVRVVDHIPMDMFYGAMEHCEFMIGNSSAAIREGSYLGTAAVNVGQRQRNRVKGVNILNALNRPKVETLAKAHKLTPPPSDLYGDEHSAQRVVDAIYKTGVMDP